LERLSGRVVSKESEELQAVNAIALKKDWAYVVFFCLQEMGVLSCDICGEEFVIGHPPQLANQRIAEEQSCWLERELVKDHEGQKKHAERIELPDAASLSGKDSGRYQRPA
jgi:hypothetical protein